MVDEAGSEIPPTPARVPQNTAEWLMYWMERLERAVKDGFQETRADLGTKASRLEVEKIESTVIWYGQRLDKIEAEQATGVAVRKSFSLVWKVIAAVIAAAYPVVLTTELLLHHG